MLSKLATFPIVYWVEYPWVFSVSFVCGSILSNFCYKNRKKVEVLKSEVTEKREYKERNLYETIPVLHFWEVDVVIHTVGILDFENQVMTLDVDFGAEDAFFGSRSRWRKFAKQKFQFSMYLYYVFLMFEKPFIVCRDIFQNTSRPNFPISSFSKTSVGIPSTSRTPRMDFG